MVVPNEIIVNEADEVKNNHEFWSKEFELRAQFWKGIIYFIQLYE